MAEWKRKRVCLLCLVANRDKVKGILLCAFDSFWVGIGYKKLGSSLFCCVQTWALGVNVCPIVIEPCLLSSFCPHTHTHTRTHTNMGNARCMWSFWKNLPSRVWGSPSQEAEDQAPPSTKGTRYVIADAIRWQQSAYILPVSMATTKYDSYDKNYLTMKCMLPLSDSTTKCLRYYNIYL